MGRRDRDERPPVELWSPVDEPAEVERVQLGGGGRGRRGGAVALVAVGALFAVGLLTQGSEEPEAAPLAQEERDNSPRDELKPDVAGRPVTSTTSRSSRTTSTTTTTTIPPGPVLGELTGGSVLVLADPGHWTWLELDTGLRSEVQVRGVGDPYGAVPVAGGLVILESTGQASLRRPGDEVGLALGPADQVLPSGRPDRVWLISFSTRSLMSGRLVDLAGEQVLTVEIPAGWVQWGGDPSGLPFTSGGRTYFADAGGVRPLADGELLAGIPGAVVVLSCDDEARCAPHRVDLETGAVVRLGEPAVSQGYFVVPGGPGDVVILTYGEVASLTWYASDGRRLGVVELPMLSHDGVAWLPGDLGLLVPTAGGLSRARLDGQGGVLLERIDGLNAPSAQQIYVVNP